MLSGIQRRLAVKVAPLLPCQCFDATCDVLPIPRRGCYEFEEFAFPLVDITPGELLTEALQQHSPLLASPVVSSSMSLVAIRTFRPQCISNVAPVVSNPMYLAIPDCIKIPTAALKIQRPWWQKKDFQLPLGTTVNCAFDDKFIGTHYTKTFRFSGDELSIPAPTSRQIDLSKVILAESRCRVSRNLLREIRSGQVAGKCYVESPAPPVDQPQLRLTSQSPRKNGYRISFTHTKEDSVTRRQSLSVWELLFPLLQKPVDLERLEQSDLPASPWHFQLAGIRFLVEGKSALLGDDMGTGKTVQTAVAMRVLFQKKKVTAALIVCPLSVLRTWDRELEKWASNLIVTVVRGTKEFRKTCWRQPTHIWLTTFDTLRNDIETVTSLHPDGFDLVVVDEAQRIKSTATGYSHAVRQIEASYRWALSGTPLENRLEDVFGVFEFVKKGLFAPINPNHPTKEQISQRAKEIYEKSGFMPGRDRDNWLKAEKELMESSSATVNHRLGVWSDGDSSESTRSDRRRSPRDDKARLPNRGYTPNEVSALIRPYFLRRRKKDVLKDLPELVEHPVWLRLEGEQLRSYEKLEHAGVCALREKEKKEELTAQSMLVYLEKLKQICNRCPRSGESAKLEWVKDNLEEIVAEGDKCLVFTQYRQDVFGGADYLENQLSEFGCLNYGKATTDRAREAILKKFKDDKKASVFISHPKTAGVGLNELVVANYVFHFDHWWNPATAHQATGRAHRPGQKKKVFAYHLWIENSYEEIIYRMIERKQNLYAEVVDSLSIGLSEEMLFEVYDELLTKYGLKVKAGEKGEPIQNRRKLPATSPVVLDPDDSTGAVTWAGVSGEGPTHPRELWENDPISTRQQAVLHYFRVSEQPGMTKGEASDIIDKLFAVQEKKESWEKAKLSKVMSFEGTPLYPFILKKRNGLPDEVDEEILDESLEIIANFELEDGINARENLFEIVCPNCRSVIHDLSKNCSKCGHDYNNPV